VGGQDGWKSGDIFLDVTGDAKYGPANTGTTGSEGVTQTQ